MIDASAYCVAFRLERAEVFALSMRDPDYQAEKKARH